MTLVQDCVTEIELPARVRLCYYAKEGFYCGHCEEALPCIKAGIEGDCDLCHLEGCPCMLTCTKERRKAYQTWHDSRLKRNNLTAFRHSLYARRRWLLDHKGPKPEPHYHNYRHGRTCSECGAAITDRGKSGLCALHARRARKLTPSLTPVR